VFVVSIFCVQRSFGSINPGSFASEFGFTMCNRLLVPITRTVTIAIGISLLRAQSMAWRLVAAKCNSF
jgi:hypothetical protein